MIGHPGVDSEPVRYPTRRRREPLALAAAAAVAVTLLAALAGCGGGRGPDQALLGRWSGSCTDVPGGPGQGAPATAEYRPDGTVAESGGGGDPVLEHYTADGATLSYVLDNLPGPDSNGLSQVHSAGRYSVTGDHLEITSMDQVTPPPAPDQAPLFCHYTRA